MRIGIVGCGLRGRLYRSALAGMEGVTVAGMADVSESARRAVPDGTIPVLETHHELFELGLDAAIVATPDFAHRDASVAAAEAGLNLMVEKPLATSVDDATAIRDAVRANGVKCLVAFENRWNPPLARMRQVVESGELGDVVSIHATLSDTYEVPLRMLSWAAQSSPGWFLMPHTVDLALWLMAKEPVEVTAAGHRGVLAALGIPTWDLLHALVRFGDGSVVNLQSSWILPESSPSIVDFRLEVLGSKGSLSFDRNAQGFRRWGATHTVDAGVPFVLDGQDQGMAAWMAQSFARRLLAGETLSPSVDQGVLVTRVVAAVHQSALEGHPVALTTQPPGATG